MGVFHNVWERIASVERMPGEEKTERDARMKGFAEDVGISFSLAIRLGFSSRVLDSESLLFFSAPAPSHPVQPIRSHHSTSRRRVCL